MTKFRVFTTSSFDRDIKKFSKFHHNNIESIFKEAILILGTDPYNISRNHNIKKLSDIKRGDGQFRIRIGDWRVRYDVENDTVILYSFKNRKEGY